MASREAVTLKTLSISDSLKADTVSKKDQAQDSLSLHQLYTVFYHACEKDSNLTVSKICEFFEVDAVTENKTLIEGLIDTHVVKNKSRFDAWRKKDNDRRQSEFSQIILNKKELKQRLKTPKRTATKEFLDLGPKQKTRRLSDLNEILVEFSENNNLEVNRILGYLLYQRNHQFNKKLAALGKQLYDNGDIEDANHKLSLDQTLPFKTHLDLSRSQLNFCKTFLTPYLQIPNEKYIQQYAKSLLPEIAPWETPPNNQKTGVFITCGASIVSLTVKRLIDMLEMQNITVPTSLIYREKTGHDGAGAMSIYKSKNSPMETANIFSKMFVPLSLSDASGAELWINPTPNSSHWCRPLALIAEKESKDLLKNINHVFEPGERDLLANGFEFDYKNVHYKVKVLIENSMKDFKVRTMESGLGGADCLLCTSRRADWKDLNKIADSNSFAIDRTAEKTLSLYKQLLKEDGEVEKSKDDYVLRQGLTSQPLSTADNHYITITHQYINGVTWVLKIMFHLRGSVLNWSERGIIKDEIQKARELVLNEIETKTGLRLDRCESAGNSGTSTTGSQGRRFFAFESRKIIVHAVPSAHRPAFAKLMHFYSVILRIVSSTENINVEKFRQLTKDFATLIAKDFPWIEYSMTSHSLIFHSAELIYKNNSKGLGEISEEALEATNKDIRNFREFLSRKCGHLENLSEVFNRLFLRSDPVVNYTVHDSWSRRKRKDKTVSTCLNQDDALFDSLMMQD